MNRKPLRTLHLYWIRVRKTVDCTLYWNVALAQDARAAHKILVRRTSILRAHLAAIGEGHWLEVQLLGACRVRGRSTLPPGWIYATNGADHYPPAPTST